MKIEIDTTLKLDREQPGIVLGKALRLPKNETGVLVFTPDGRFTVVNKRGIKERDEKEIFPALIIAARKYRKLTQVELAKKTGITTNAIASWEIGRRNPQLITVMSILWICGIVDKWDGIEK